MIIEFTHGKVIANMHEVVVRLNAGGQVTLQAQIDALTLIGRGANVITAYDMQCQWSVALDNDVQLQQVADFIGVPVKR
ncbi:MULTISPECIES: DUF3389 family protein [Vibrio]|uniref:DUF3389 family protein n=1 Tax=Vibrio algicola TaxID=2662262 RepID=A0A5Q0TGZ8_9VIBR|nr:MULTISPECIES: DUF3389 family protein [Vibrio]MBD1576619.1 DUF3389 family protein [Vibrio sp. S11_S32]